jgi:protein involved in polysaccharide export with SLBB domain
LLKLYASQITSKEIVVALESASFTVYVTGAVVKPGPITSNHPITALQSIMEAGGFDLTTANMKTVKIIRNENGLMKHYAINLKAVLDGSSDKTFYMKPDDIIYVTERFQPF